MRIAQVAPLFESVPPQGYGGTERVVSYLTEELVRQGHEVTLYASGDSVTQAHLIPCCPRSLRLDETCIDQLAHQLLMVHRVIQDASNYDLIHFHIDYLHFPMSQRQPVPHLTTLHGRLDIPDLQSIYRVFPKQPLVSISDAQRQPMPPVNWLGTVYHGLPPHLFTFRKKPGKYLAFLGRISQEKRPDRAIRVAQQAGIPLKIAAKVDKADYEYYRSEIEPMIRDAGRSVEFIGEVGGRDKDEFLGNALALVFPIDWPEPFGLVMIEAMACGTPVITRPCGSVPEVMEDGVTGFVVDSDEAELDAVRKVGDLDRRACRRTFERRFAASRMAADYVAVYRRLMQSESQSESELKKVRRRGPRKTFQAIERVLARKAVGRRVALARSTLATLDPE